MTHDELMRVGSSIHGCRPLPRRGRGRDPSLRLSMMMALLVSCGQPGQDDDRPLAKWEDLPLVERRSLTTCDVYPHLEYDATRYSCFAGPDRFHFTDCRPGHCVAVRLKVHYLMPRDLGPGHALVIRASPAAGPEGAMAAILRRIRYHPRPGSAPEEHLFVDRDQRYCFSAKLVAPKGDAPLAHSDVLCAEVGTDTSLWFGDLFIGPRY